MSLQTVVNVVYWVDLHLSVESTEEYSGAVLDACERLYFIVVEFEHSEVVDRKKHLASVLGQGDQLKVF